MITLFKPISYYLSQNIYAYYKTPNHIIFDEELTILLKKNISAYRKNNNHIIFNN